MVDKLKWIYLWLQKRFGGIREYKQRMYYDVLRLGGPGSAPALTLGAGACCNKPF
jgi:hypothetical protein